MSASVLATVSSHLRTQPSKPQLFDAALPLAHMPGQGSRRRRPPQVPGAL